MKVESEPSSLKSSTSVPNYNCDNFLCLAQCRLIIIIYYSESREHRVGSGVKRNDGAKRTIYFYQKNSWYEKKWFVLSDSASTASALCARIILHRKMKKSRSSGRVGGVVGILLFKIATLTNVVKREKNLLYDGYTGQEGADRAVCSRSGGGVLWALAS